MVTETKLPDSWSLNSLKELVLSVQYGHTASASEERVGPKFLRITDLQNNSVEWEKVPFCQCDEVSKYILKTGDIVIARTGATTGKSFLLRELQEDTVFASYLIRLSTSESFPPDYLGLFMQSPDYWRQITVVSKGSAQPGANAKILSGLQVPLPPLNEQRRIVQKIEALTAHSRKARQALDSIPALLDQFRQSVLAAAFRGDLTADWRAANPDVEPASALLERISEQIAKQYAEQVDQAKQQGCKKPKQPSLLKNKDVLSRAKNQELEIPYATVQLEALCPSDGLFDGPFGSKLKTSDYVDKGIRVIRLENIGFLKFIEDKFSFVSLEKYEELRKHTVHSDDLLFASFASEGVRACLLTELDETAIAKADCFCIRPFTQLIDKSFLLLQLSGPIFYTQLEELMHGATRLRVSLTQLRKTEIRLFSLAEQDKINEIVETMFDVAMNIESQYKQSIEQLQALDQSILAKAFRGQLVPQDPTDEPASLLLDRIRTEREAAAAAAKAAKKAKRKTRKKS